MKRGQAVSFRLPADTPDHLLKQLQQLKESERRNFSSKIAQFVLDGVGQTYKREQDVITIPLPKSLTKEQRDWLKHEHSEALIGTIIHQLISDPLRATSIFASFTTNHADYEEAIQLYDSDEVRETEETASPQEDDLDAFQFERVEETTPEREEENVEDILGGFLERMNK